MKFVKSKFNGLFIINPELREDTRGYFTRIFCRDELRDHDINFPIVQINRSLTKKKGTIRGIHFQKKPKEEGKIVQCLKGSIYDVAIDLRPQSETFGKWIGQVLSEENKRMVLIPEGFAHGFQTLSNNCEVLYLMSKEYAPGLAAGYHFDDPYFSIKWPLKPTVIAENDKQLPFFTP